MSLVTATRGKGKSKKTVTFKGHLTGAQWASLKGKIRALSKRHNLKLYAPARRRAKKKAR
jgi:hypothetical protein